MNSDSPGTSHRPAAGGRARRPRGRSRRGLAPARELTLILLLGAIGAGLVFLAMRPGWAHVRTAVPAPLPASVVTVSGQDLVPFADALAIAALASLAAVLATRRGARRAAGVLLAGLGAGIAVAVATGVSATLALAAAAGHLGPAAGSGAGATAGSVTEGGSQTGTAVPEVAGFHARATLTATAWQSLAILGAVAIVAAGILVIWRAQRLPVMSSRYDSPAGSGAASAGTASAANGSAAVGSAANGSAANGSAANGSADAHSAGGPAVSRQADGTRRDGADRDALRADSASMWESLSRGEDPTGTGRAG